MPQCFQGEPFRRRRHVPKSKSATHSPDGGATDCFEFCEPDNIFTIPRISIDHIKTPPGRWRSAGLARLTFSFSQNACCTSSPCIQSLGKKPIADTRYSPTCTRMVKFNDLLKQAHMKQVLAIDQGVARTAQGCGDLRGIRPIHVRPMPDVDLNLMAPMSN